MADVMVLVPDQNAGDADILPVATSGYEHYESPTRREALIQAIFFAPAERDDHGSFEAQPAIAA